MLFSFFLFLHHLTASPATANDQTRAVNVRLMAAEGNGMQVPVGRATKVQIKGSLA